MKVRVRFRDAPMGRRTLGTDPRPRRGSGPPRAGPHPGTLVLVVLVAALSACSDPAAPDARSLVGSWDMIGFSDDGVEALTTGTWTFRSDGTHSFEGTITFPGEPVEGVAGQGTWDQTGTRLEMAIGDTRSSFWDVEISGDEATLTADEPPPANWIRLRRQ